MLRNKLRKEQLELAIRLCVDFYKCAETLTENSWIEISPRTQVLLEAGDPPDPVLELYVGFSRKSDASKFVGVVRRSGFAHVDAIRKAERSRAKWEVCLSNTPNLWAARIAVLDAEAFAAEQAISVFLKECVASDRLTKGEGTKMLNSVRRSNKLLQEFV